MPFEVGTPINESFCGKCDECVKHCPGHAIKAIKAAQSGFVEMILFSINPAFDMLPASEDINTMFADEFDSSLKGIDPDRALLHKICEQNDVGITVMKGFAGGTI